MACSSQYCHELLHETVNRHIHSKTDSTADSYYKQAARQWCIAHSAPAPLDIIDSSWHLPSRRTGCSQSMQHNAAVNDTAVVASCHSRAHYRKTRCHPQNWKYIMYYNATREEPSNGNRQKNLVSSGVRF